MVFDILTIFPKLIQGYLSDSILKREIIKGTITVRIHNIRDYTKNKHRKVDDKPYGGGAGMLMTPQPIYDCIRAVKLKNRGANRGAPVIYLTPAGKKFNYQIAKKYSKGRGIILLCGRYEGIDNRIRKLCIDEEISIGDYVLTGGELPALVVMDAVTRLLPGALGDSRSAHEDSFTEALGGKKEYPHYTRPPLFKGLKVPAVLLTGDHKKINDFRWKNLR